MRYSPCYGLAFFCIYMADTLHKRSKCMNYPTQDKPFEEIHSHALLIRDFGLRCERSVMDVAFQQSNGRPRFFDGRKQKFSPVVE